MNDINSLRESIFETITALKAGSIDVEKAKVIGDLSQVIINSAKVEVDYIRANGGGQAGFFNSDPLKQVSQTKTGTKTVEGNSTVHKLHG